MKFSIFVQMLHKTRAIVLYNSNYSDIYSIVHLLTEEFGPVSYLIAKAKGKKTRVPKSVFHPLSVLDLEVEHLNLRNIQRIKEAKVHIPLISLLNNPVKSTISIFLVEFIGKVVRDAQPDKLLFDYIFRSVQVLELYDKNYANFHLVFMIRLSQFLGFYPDSGGYVKGMYFDLQNGVFVSYKPMHVHFLHPDESGVFFNLLRMSYDNMANFKFSGKERKNIIYRIIEYYRLHLTNFPEIKSLEILHEVFE
ncbi:MAG: recombination protein O N-terminal domain-containing protein [Candidatus Symbiothrix sp.]|jgi:DNA repair protein RecO (recombination protein O)|nr:recombination protein O N-terminal domain-containing protein [Candidatus Symbiothrix sp.]